MCRLLAILLVVFPFLCGPSAAAVVIVAWPVAALLWGRDVWAD